MWQRHAYQLPKEEQSCPLSTTVVIWPFRTPMVFCLLDILSFSAKDCGEFEVRSTELIRGRHQIPMR